ncbi:hypothetical protein JRQ81_011566 [Phrynocephalus forsythii]|uniref:Uncharacterized protein n=1 Tax=Phrynocephalus forsythii TaxID=171643 RepID=A0A9Q1AQM3_9SAUR|nr:hypothetical protein JRQ81_011566 [Phrynocephalus forsythii]
MVGGVVDMGNGGMTYTVESLPGGLSGVNGMTTYTLETVPGGLPAGVGMTYTVA